MCVPGQWPDLCEWTSFLTTCYLDLFGQPRYKCKIMCQQIRFVSKWNSEILSFKGRGQEIKVIKAGNRSGGTGWVSPPSKSERWFKFAQLHFWFSFLLMDHGGSRRWLKYLGPYYPFGRPGWSFWLLVSVWPSSSHCSHLRSEPVRRYQSFSPTFQVDEINKHVAKRWKEV